MNGNTLKVKYTAACELSGKTNSLRLFDFYETDNENDTVSGLETVNFIELC